MLAIGAACGDLASVPYNAMLRQLSTPQNSGRISGLGLTAAFIGSVGLLLVVFFGFISGDGATRGFLQLPAADGMNVRIAMLVAAGWFAVFALPLLLTAYQLPAPVEAPAPRIGVLGGYRKLWRDLVEEWHRDRNLVYYLLASAVFRDGLAGVFPFGGVLGVNAYGISPAVVLIFGVAAAWWPRSGPSSVASWMTGSAPNPSSSARWRASSPPGCHVGACRDRARSGSPDCCCACSSDRRRLRRERCCYGCPATAKKAWRSVFTR